MIYHCVSDHFINKVCVRAHKVEALSCAQFVTYVLNLHLNLLNENSLTTLRFGSLTLKGRSVKTKAKYGANSLTDHGVRRTKYVRQDKERSCHKTKLIRPIKQPKTSTKLTKLCSHDERIIGEPIFALDPDIFYFVFVRLGAW